MNILDKIIEFKRSEIEKRRSAVNIAELEKAFYFNRERLSLKRLLQDGNKTGIITEFKRRSPSKGIINDKASVEEISQGYATNGASGISILTDEEFFGGTLADLQKAAIINKIPFPSKKVVYKLFR